MTLRALICEDEPLARETLRDFIADTPGLGLIGEATHGAEALKLCRLLRPDVVFMDIQMPELTGLQVVEQLQASGEAMPQLIFTTAYDQHAVTAFELHALDYLLKPFTRARFDAAVRRAVAEPDAAPDRDLAAQGAIDALRASGPAAEPLSRILVRDRGRIFPLAMNAIEHLRSDMKYTQITAGGQSYLVRMALNDLEARLDPRRFLRIHRNAIINLDFVASMRADEQSQLQVFMQDGTELLANREASKRLRELAI